jgi:hypothetical protein
MSMTTESAPTRKRALAWGLAAALFVSGAAAGAAVDRWLGAGEHRRGEGRWWERRRPEALARKFKDELGLDEAQARAVEAVLVRTWNGTRRALQPVEPQIDAIRRSGDEEIRALLRPEQRARFEEMVAEQERRRAAMRKGLDAPPEPR